MPREWGECPVCRVTTWLEEEHVVPLWIERLIHDWGPFTEMVDGEVAGEPTDWMNIVVGLCRRCNKRLGKKFEEPASRIMKPMIYWQPTDPTTMLLTRGDQATIGRWVVKTIVLRSFIAGVAVPQGFWKWLMAGGKPAPPFGTHVWIARYPRQTQKDTILPEKALEPVRDLRLEWKSPHFHIGELAMFVAHQRIELDGVITHPAEHYDVLTRVLPKHHDTVIWPPQKRIGKADLTQINGAIIVP